MAALSSVNILSNIYLEISTQLRIILVELAIQEIKYKRHNMFNIPVIHLAKVKSTTAC